MPVNMERLVVFGDSLSDIGRKRNSHWGNIARGLRRMRTNAVYRYSDTRNWTDWIWEWSGGNRLITSDAPTSIVNSAKHLKWSMESNSVGRGSGVVTYANYAEGGALGASDMNGVGLGTFAQQVERYLRHIKTLPVRGRGLYLVWFGLNDFVTNSRPGTAAAPVAREIVDLCKEVQKQDPSARFVIGNLPNPLSAVRFSARDLNDTEAALRATAINFNGALLNEVGDGSWGGDVVDIFEPMEHVNRNLNDYGLIGEAQPKGVEVRYSDAPLTDPRLAREARMVATSDEAHPTEAVYKVLAQLWGQKILTKYDLGLLRASTEAVWPRLGNNN